MNVKNTQDFVKLLVALMGASKSKGPVFMMIPKLTTLLYKAMSNIRKIPKEIKDMTPEEEKQIRAIVEKTIGKDKDLVPDDIEVAVITMLKAM